MMFLFLLSLLPLLNLFVPGLPVTHDGQDHVVRIANFYKSLSEGNLVPRWASNLNWGYGHPVVMFLYPLPSYIASLFHALGFSLVDSTKLVFAVSFVASIVAMYLWLKDRWGKVPGFTGAILYGFAPYRFVDLYVRGAIGEHVAFIFPPLILLGLDRQSFFLTSLSTAGLILSHNAISLMFVPIIILYIIYKRNAVIKSFYFLSVGFALSAFFWIPAFFEGKYTLREIVTKGTLMGRFVPWQWFFFSPWNYGGGNQFTKELGLGQWLVVFGAAGVFFFRKNKKTRWLLGGSLFIFIAALFFMTQGSSTVWNSITLLQKFQFPWRLLSVVVFMTSFLGTVFVAHLPKKFVFGVSILLVVVSLISTTKMWKAKAYLIRSESFYSDIYAGTTDTGESSPIWSVRFMEQIPKEKIAVIQGDAIIKQVSRTTTSRSYTVFAQTPTRLVENTLYFPGWQAFIDDQPTIVEFQDPNFRGLITFWVNPGENQIRIVFGDTKLRQFANTISFIGIALLIITFFVVMRLKIYHE